MVQTGIIFQLQDRNSMSQLVGYYWYVKYVMAVVYRNFAWNIHRVIFIAQTFRPLMLC